MWELLGSTSDPPDVRSGCPEPAELTTKQIYDREYMLVFPMLPDRGRSVFRVSHENLFAQAFARHSRQVSDKLSPKRNAFRY